MIACAYRKNTIEFLISMCFFLYIGGIPKVVDSYVKNNDYNGVRKIQNKKKKLQKMKKVIILKGEIAIKIASI